MKKILSISFVLILISASVSAQKLSDNIRRQHVREGFKSGQITRPERTELRKDAIRYKAVKHHARKDGKITPRERKRLHTMRKHNRHETFRFKHNRHHRVI